MYMLFNFISAVGVFLFFATNMSSIITTLIMPPSCAALFRHLVRCAGQPAFGAVHRQGIEPLGCLPHYTVLLLLCRLQQYVATVQ